MKKATFVQYYATRYNYRVTAYDEDSQPVEEYTAGNHPGDSQGYLTPKKHYEIGEVRPVPVGTLRKWARQTAEEMAKKHNIPKDKISYDHDGEDDENEAYASL